MNELETGVTQPQISAAINRKFDRHYGHCAQRMQPESISTICSLFYPEMAAHAADLVPSDQRIVSVDDVDRLLEGYAAWTQRHTTGENQAERMAFVERISGLLR